MNNPPKPPPPPSFPNGLQPLPNADDVPELIDVIQQDDEKHVEGSKVKINTILNIPLVFLEWSFEITQYKDAKSEEFVRIHFYMGDKLCYIETASSVIMDQVKLFEKLGGKRPFKAIIRFENGRYFKFFRTK